MYYLPALIFLGFAIIFGIFGAFQSSVLSPAVFTLITLFFFRRVFYPRSGVDKRNVILAVVPIAFAWLAYWITTLMR